MLSLHRLLKAQQAFKNVFAIAVLPIPQYSRLQLLAMRSLAKIKIFPGMSELTRYWCQLD